MQTPSTGECTERTQFHRKCSIIFDGTDACIQTGKKLRI